MAGTNMICTGKKYIKKALWFNEECMKKKMEMEAALRKLKKKMTTKADLSTEKAERHMKE
jgi:hypothetical protein